MFARDLGLLFFGKVIVSCAVWMYSTAAALLLYAHTQSTTAIALGAAAQFGPQLILTPLSGALADRCGAAPQIIVGRLISIAGAGVLAGWSGRFLGSASESEVVVAVSISASLVGLGFVIGGPAMQAIVPRLVTSDELTTASVLNTTPATVARIAGPVAGAWLFATAGPMWTFGVIAVLHAAFVPMVILARLPRKADVTHGHDGSVRAAVRVIAEHPVLSRCFIGLVAVGIGSEPVLTLAPALAAHFGYGESAAGTMNSAFGIGAAIALVVLAACAARLSSRWMSGAGTAMLVAGLLAAGLVSTLWACCVAIAVAGAGFSSASAGFSAAVQKISPAEFRGRIMALWITALVGTRPVAAGIAAVSADVVSAQFGCITVAVVVAVMGMAAVRRRKRMT
ncbi:hypothetical protein CH267_12920 [Rhodococcus sp. 06-621-2]|nr:MFS transporter [Rhodococcus sp. 06-621-2]OZC55476.1 hypothetical protein CH267_12920 [Rhodococcus sp. 06-621-2]